MIQNKRFGFTLVEVLTVIAIIALLAALILGLAGNAQKKAARTKAEAEVTQLGSFVTDYQTKYGQVPPSSNDLKKALAAANHPSSNFLDPWGTSYGYSNSSKVTFYLWSQGGDTTGTNRQLWIGSAP